MMVIMTRVKHKFLLNAILILNANSITTNYIITTTFTSLQISPSPSPVSPSPLLPILASTYLWAAMISGGQAKFSRGMSANLDFYCDQYDFIKWIGWQHWSSKLWYLSQFWCWWYDESLMMLREMEPLSGESLWSPALGQINHRQVRVLNKSWILV